MREKIYSFMAGRNGPDQLSRFLNYAALVFIVLDLLIKSTVGSLCGVFGIALMIYSYYRTFSRDVYRRRTENYKFCQKWNKLTGGVRGRFERLRQMRDYRFFRCPDCSAMLRLPRGKGKIRVTCSKCGNSFIRKT